ncbi:MAG: XdhC family protein [Elusimicrobia bacterium]|nr:XdhC family protein [Elusimicrobiota bacterium]
MKRFMSNNQNEVLERVAELSGRGSEFVLATIVSSSKGSPRKSGSKMIIFPDGSIEFTIGGGNLEEMTIQKSMKAIKSGENASFEVEFTEDKSGMACGGKAEIFLEVFKAKDMVAIFGAGHIGMALSRILDILGIPYIVADDRREFADKKRFPNACQVKAVSYEKAVKELGIGKNHYCVIVTHGHKGDKKVLRDLLTTESEYLGMIGSDKKVNAVLNEIKKEGVSLTQTRIYAPVGLDIGGDTPEEIALSIAAEILKIKYKRTGRSYKDMRPRR